MAAGQEDARRLAWMRLWSAYVCSVLERAGVEHLLIKGCSWQAPLALPVVPTDVDVLVAPWSFGAARQALRDAGMGPAHDIRDGEGALHSATLQAPGGPEIDLHRSFPGLDEDPATFWHWASTGGKTHELAHVTVAVPGSAAQLALALAAAARDGAGSRSALRVTQAGPLVDWPAMLAELRPLRVEGTVRAGLTAAGRSDLADQLGLGPVHARFAPGSTAAERRLEEVLAQPWSQRIAVTVQELWPSRGFLALSQPGVPTWTARRRHLARIVTELPRAARAVAVRRRRRDP